MSAPVKAVGRTGTDETERWREGLEGVALQAAFFDVDGTLAGTDINRHLVYLARQALSSLAYLLWALSFGVKGVGFPAVDKLSRRLSNLLIYRGYRGKPAGATRATGRPFFEDVYKPRTFPSAQQCVRSLKEQGLRIVLVTGAIDFTIEPMAAYLEADALLAASLEEVNGVFTMDGGHKSLTVGLGTYETVRHNHNPATLGRSALMDPANSALACSFARQGRIVQDACKVFRIETELNSNAFPPTCRSCRNRSVPMGRSTGRRPGCRPWPALICRCR